MKYIINAHHHGAFLTIRQLTEWDLDFVVMVPQSQVDKYSAMDEAVFKNYLKNVRKAAKDRPIVMYDERNWIRAANRILEETGATGNWMALQAGSLLLSAEEVTTPTRFGFVERRVHPKFKRLYVMLGEDEASKELFNNAFVINMDATNMRVSTIDSNKFMRPDTLYANSFGALWRIRYRQMTKEAVTMSFWMESMRGSAEESMAYPFHIYGEYAKKVKALLPKETYAAITERAEESAWLQDIVALDL